MPNEDDDFRYYRVYRSLSPLFEPNPADLLGTTAESSFLDAGAGYQVHYLITAVDFAGNESEPTRSPLLSGARDGLPALFALEQNTPNPFNPRTTISFTLPRDEAVTLVVHDLAGRTVRTLLAGVALPSGTHDVVWNGDDDGGRPAAAGVYFYGVRTPSSSETKRMALVR